MILSPLQEQALSVLETYIERRAVIDAANDTIKKALVSVGECTADFCGLHVNDMDARVLTAFCGLLDAIWGQPDSGLADYYLHECIGPRGHGGGIQCCGRKTWKLRSIEELRKYLEHAQVCKGRPPSDRPVRFSVLQPGLPEGFGEVAS